ncbi:MAG TPA: TlyA family RNA methyltransferase [Kiritimatiellia bacterium]|nr:TlyA family RNA methyltransferase [Kiritimatiellia bacterium]HMO97581.1 TlyA family RNA methyltransferase [Kiritimatiellia bacterium]HMP96778.1 TlyA family RNA methyltransferase [Kiritimatiellia bacterium]
MTRLRLDLLLVQQGLAESREKAQRLIRAGVVRLGGHPQNKPGHLYPEDTVLEIDQPERFVSRGGEKLETAFRQFGLDVTGRVAADIGASTGGFTDCLLQHGARKVVAVDVGQGQLHWRLRNDPRVVVHEGVNARQLDPALFDEKPTFAVVDVSFISLTLILPPLVAVLSAPAEIVTLIKPQFEAGREQVGKNGVVRDPAVHQEVIERIRRFGEQSAGLRWRGCCESAIKGPAGNTEFLAWWEKPARIEHAPVR